MRSLVKMSYNALQDVNGQDPFQNVKVSLALDSGLSKQAVILETFIKDGTKLKCMYYPVGKFICHMCT